MEPLQAIRFNARLADVFVFANSGRRAQCRTFCPKLRSLRNFNFAAGHVGDHLCPEGASSAAAAEP
ncbi:hypothetical protein A6U85_25405 [Agrobacterium sp. 13-626]|nr:hypothetical protein A6U85_25405 [Agrobacterium sp. 13-626]